MKEVIDRPETKPTTGGGSGVTNLRHYVKLDDKGQPADEALCGYVWDRLHVKHNGEICQACVDISKTIKREGPR